MIHRVDDKLRAEVERFAMRFTCGDCVQLDPDRGACSLGYPNALHLDPSLDDRDEVVFCKAFELA